MISFLDYQPKPQLRHAIFASQYVDFSLPRSRAAADTMLFIFCITMTAPSARYGFFMRIVAQLPPLPFSSSHFARLTLRFFGR
jgi:hypothetical protein